MYIKRLICKAIFWSTHLLHVQTHGSDNAYSIIFNQKNSCLILGSMPLTEPTLFKFSNSFEQLAEKFKNLNLVVAAVTDLELAGVLDIKSASKINWQKIDINFSKFPICDFGIVKEINIEHFNNILKQIYKTLINDKASVYVHCKAGKGRSWLVVACYLLKYGLPHKPVPTAPEVITFIKKQRPLVRPNRKQRKFVYRYAQCLRPNIIQGS